MFRCCQYPPERVELTVIKTAEPVNVRGILQSKGQVTAEEFVQLRRAVASDQVVATRQEIESLLREIESGAATGQSVRAGIGAYLLAQHAVAERLLSDARDGRLDDFTFLSAALIASGVELEIGRASCRERV